VVETARFVEVRASARVPGRVVEALHDRTEGNPLLLAELVRSLPCDAGDIESWERALPLGLRQVIGQRLRAALPEFQWTQGRTRAS
jgi:hypothetical protein